MDMSKQVIIVASAYDEKYYFNDKYKGLPELVKQDLIKIAVTFAEDVGGIFIIGFKDDGEVYLEVEVDEEDLLYDDIGSKLNINKIQKEYVEFFQALTKWYKFIKEKGQ